MRKPRFNLFETRRAFLGQASMGLGSAALASLLKPSLLGVQPGIGGFPNGRGRVKRIIFLCMAGGPAHLELLDHKPELAKRHGEPMPESFTKGQQIAQLQGKELRILGPRHPFRHYGESGQHMTSLLPHIGSIADDICIVRSMQTEQINHDTAHTFMNSGFRLAGRPSMGSWLLYGLGSESEDLPGFVVLTSEGGSQSQPIAARQWNSGFLPSIYQGVKFNSTGDPVNYVRNPRGVSREMQGELIDAVSELNAVQQGWTRDPEIATRIAQYELAFRMQMSVPDLVDFSDEPAARSGHVRHAAGRRHVRRQLPAGATDGGTRRPLHPPVPPRMGPSQRDQDAASQELRLRRSGHCGSRQGPQAARAVRGHADRLVRGVRQDPDVAGNGSRSHGPGPPHQGLLDVDGGRRHQGPATATAQPTSLATTRSRT